MTFTHFDELRLQTQLLEQGLGPVRPHEITDQLCPLLLHLRDPKASLAHLSQNGTRNPVLETGGQQLSRILGVGDGHELGEGLPNLIGNRLSRQGDEALLSGLGEMLGHDDDIPRAQSVAQINEQLRAKLQGPVPWP